MSCTWQDCEEQGKHVHKDKQGRVWSTLCDKHHEMIEELVYLKDPKQILARWVKASGGPKKLAHKMTYGS